MKRERKNLLNGSPTGTPIAVSNTEATTVHTGNTRGTDEVHLTLNNSGSSAADATITVADSANTLVVAVAAKSIVPLPTPISVAYLATLKIQGSAAGIRAFGHVIENEQ